MANWAIVIGVDHYWKPEACLRGAVRDALKMREWLINPDGGNISNKNCRLLLSPGAHSPTFPAGVTVLPATSDQIVITIEDVLLRSSAEGENFYFYFSGHGLTSNMGYENGIIPSDFTEILTNKSISLRSILKLFQATRFQKQFFFIDACRNIPWERDFQIAEYPQPRIPTPPAPQQYIMYATSPGIKAQEINEAGNERGAFTDALLAGLAGKGDAKAWDVETQQYFVRWDSLFNYVYKSIVEQKLVTDDQYMQEPRKDLMSGTSENPMMSTYSSGVFPDEVLQVHINPATIATQTKIDIGDWGEVVKQVSSISNLPVEFTLQPRTYSVKGNAPNHKMDKSKYLVNLYGPEKVTLQFVQAPATRGGTGSVPPVDFTRGLTKSLQPGSLTVQAGDPILQVEILDNTGKTLGFGSGNISVGNLKPGIYRARSLTPEGTFEEQLVEILPGESETVNIAAPKIKASAVFNNLLNNAGIPIQDGATIQPSEAIGTAANMQLSTILALVGGVKAEPETGYGHHLRNISIRAFQEVVGTQANCGIQVLFGMEQEKIKDMPQFFAEVLLQSWQIGESIPLESYRPDVITGFDSLAEFALAKPPGPHWLSLQLPNQKPIVFALNLLPGRVVLIIVNQDLSGKINIYQYAPSLQPEEPGDPRYQAARFPVLRRLEFIQRAFVAGNLNQAYQNAWELLQAKWIEPVAGCLGGYIVLKRNEAFKLANVVYNMTNYYGGLCDSYVLKSAYEASKNHDSEAGDALKVALDHGLPWFSDGLEILVTGIGKYQIDHPNTQLAKDVYRNRIRGLLWTAFQVKDLKPGPSFNFL